MNKTGKHAIRKRLPGQMCVRIAYFFSIRRVYIRVTRKGLFFFFTFKNVFEMAYSGGLCTAVISFCIGPEVKCNDMAILNVNTWQTKLL